ncbi:MAG: helix-turn-helix domain-containing protein [Candidatus Muirbacterium halophilum]|nr:helix-turn-helix domain-containing protein [Candidatus Muirbacterium halophilum]MCK9476177.1 helix-turn-helix domain-containing protein [Candidatus Muirbacterium halophilum]
MPRKARELIDKGIYIIHSRGIKNLNIFADDKVKIHFIGLLQKCSVRYGVKIFFYSIFKNDYFLLIKDDYNNLRYCFRYLNSVFTKFINKLKKKRGAVFFDRYKSYVVREDELRLAVIYLSSVVSGLYKKDIDYKWSSYRFLNSYKNLPFFNGEILKQIFDYNKLNSDFTDISKKEIDNSKKYFKNIDNDKENLIQVINLEEETKKREKRIALEKLFSVVENIKERNRMIIIAHTKYNYLLSEIARFLNLSPSTISRVIKFELK